MPNCPYFLPPQPEPLPVHPALTLSARLPSVRQPELVAELTAALMTCECVIANTTRWRLHAGLLERLSSLADCFPPDHLYHCWVPTVLQKLHTVVRLYICYEYILFYYILSNIFYSIQFRIRAAASAAQS